MAKKTTYTASKEHAERYTALCNLIETLWVRRLDKNYYEIDTANLVPMTSPQARRIANFIEELYA